MASVENHEVNITSPASLQPPAASQIKVNGDMSWYHTANQVETNFPTLNNFLKHFGKKIILSLKFSCGFVHSTP